MYVQLEEYNYKLLILHQLIAALSLIFQPLNQYQ